MIRETKLLHLPEAFQEYHMQTSLTYDNVCVPEVYTVYTCNLDDQDPRYDPGKTHTLLSAKKNTQQHK